MDNLCKIRDIYRAIAEFENSFIESFNLSLNEGMLLCTLNDLKQLTSSEIAELLGLSASNTSKLIRSVEDKGLVQRSIGIVDKRQMIFVLTEQGISIIEQIKSTDFQLSGLLKKVVMSV